MPPTSRATSSLHAWWKDANGVEALAGGVSVDDVFARLEAFDDFRPIDQSVRAEGFQAASSATAKWNSFVAYETRAPRPRDAIDADQIVLERGAVPTSRDFLHLDCSATGTPALPAKPVFEGDRITLQWVRMLQPTFSWSLIENVEATYRDEAKKNRICAPIAPPDRPKDWVRMMATELSNQLVGRRPQISAIGSSARALTPYTRRIG